MKIDELVPLAYSLHLYKVQNYDCIKYNYKINSNMKNQMDIYFERNKMYLAEFLQYETNQAKFRLIITYFINNKQIPCNCSNKDYELLIYNLENYKMQFELFFRKILTDVDSYNRLDVYKMYTKKEIPFYVFYYVQLHGKFNKSTIGSELMQDSFKHVHKVLQFFKCFDDEWIKNVINNMNNHINLSKN